MRMEYLTLSVVQPLAHSTHVMHAEKSTHAEHSTHATNAAPYAFMKSVLALHTVIPGDETPL